jgi:hypothetical protein
MLKNTVLATFLAISSSFAVSLDEMVDNVLNKNHDLKSLEQSIEVANEQIKISKNWQNPVLTIGANDIQFDEPTKRDLEPMQAQYIGFSQVLPMGDKLEIKEAIAQKDKSIATYLLDDKKLQLKSKIYEYGHNIVILEKKYELLNKYQQNIKSLEALTNALYENGRAKQTDIINVKIAYSKVALRKQNLKNLINNLYLKLEEITFTKVSSIEAPLKMKPLIINTAFNNHPKLLMISTKSEKFNDISRLELEKKISDIKLNVAYFQRDSKYEDYANISINIPLAVYGTESVKALKAKLKAKEIQSSFKNLKQKFKTASLMFQNDMDNAIETYKIIEQTIIPLKEEVQKNIEAYNSFNLIKPQDTINNLNEVIAYEMMLLDEIKKYFTAYSKSLYFTQGNK